MSEVNSLSIRVKIPERSESYEITIGSGLYERLADLLDIKAFSKIFIISEGHLLKLYADSIQKSIPHKIHEIIIESGESSKKVSSLENIWNQLALNSCDRQSLILNLGGGVIGDLGGFAAACFMRGVTFVQL
jgi:3-dehydroquinate synthase